MSGPEHYQAAERALGAVEDDSESAMALLAEAQVHATLALAAATALSRFSDLPADDSDAWMAAAATPRPAESSPDQ